MTRRWTFSGAPDADQSRQIEATLQQGGVVLMPTDTIYGLHAVASNAAAVERIGTLKGRDDTRPFIVLASSLAQVRALGVTAAPAVLDALDALWPAALTAILPIASPLPASRGAMTVAVRIPALEWLRALIGNTGPLVSTSANRSGEPAIRAVDELAADLQDALAGIADGGVQDGKASAILDLTGTEPRFIREGDPSFTQAVWKSLRKTR